MRYLTSCLFSALLLIAATATAGEAFDPAARAKRVAPFLDETTFAVVRADVARVEIDSVVALLGRLIPGASDSEIPGNLKEVEGIRDAFIKAGGKEIFVVVNMLDLPDVVFLVPLGPGADEKALATIFPPPLTGRRHGDVLAVSSPEVLERLLAAESDARPELAAAFEAAGDTAAQAVLIPPTYAARVIDELVENIGEVVPGLPAEIGNAPGSVIAKGITWAALGVDVEPKVALKLVVRSEDEAAAKALHQTVTGAIDFMGEQPDVQQYLPTFDKLAVALTPKLEADRLTITLDEELGGIDAVVATLSASAEKARATAQRAYSVDQLKRIGLAMHNYAHATGRFPAAASYDAEGRPLLSWRVHLLRFLRTGELHELYKQFHLDEPWDSEHNRTLIEKMPAEYGSTDAAVGPGRTVFLIPVGDDTLFSGREGVTLSEIKNFAQTIMVVESDAEHAVIWTKPEDLPFDPANPAKGLGRSGQKSFEALFGDGHVEHILLTNAEWLRDRFTRDAKAE